MVNICTRSCLKTLRIGSSHRMKRLSEGSCRSCALMCFHRRFVTSGRDSCPVSWDGTVRARAYLCVAEKFGKRCRQVEWFLCVNQYADAAGERMILTWKPVFFLGLSSDGTSESSEPVTRA